MRKEITIHAGDTAAFRNLTDYCVGTGRVDLALHRANRIWAPALPEKWERFFFCSGMRTKC